MSPAFQGHEGTLLSPIPCLNPKHVLSENTHFFDTLFHFRKRLSGVIPLPLVRRNRIFSQGTFSTHSRSLCDWYFCVFDAIDNLYCTDKFGER
jgi:hypothetical protein